MRQNSPQLPTVYYEKVPKTKTFSHKILVYVGFSLLPSAENSQGKAINNTNYKSVS
jgi:hypothetical protein